MPGEPSTATVIAAQPETDSDDGLVAAIEALPGTVVAGRQVLDVMFCGGTRELWTTELRQAIAQVEELIVNLQERGAHQEAEDLIQMLDKMNQALETEQLRISRQQALLSGGAVDPKLQSTFNALVKLRHAAVAAHPGAVEQLAALQTAEIELPECKQGWEMHEVALTLENVSAEFAAAELDSTASELSELAAVLHLVADEQAKEDEAAFLKVEFDAADANSDGAISREEFAKACEKEGIRLAGASAWCSGEPREALAQAVALCQLILEQLGDGA